MKKNNTEIIYFRVHSVEYLCNDNVFRHGNDLSDLGWDQVLTGAVADDLPNITLVIDLLLTLPSTSVRCETAFSQLKLLKTCRRQKMGETVLLDLMTVKLLSPSIDAFNPESAIDSWLVSLT